MSEEQAKQFLDQATQSLQSGQFQQALELIDQAIALKEDSEAHILRGIALSQLGQPDQATDAFRNSIRLSPFNAKAYYNLAVHQYQQGQKAEAIEMAKEAVRLDAKHAGARDLVARIEAESMPNAGVQAPRVEEPIAPAGPGQAPPTIGGAAPGPQAPYQAPVQPPGGYYRPGYETSGVHSLQFVGNMGKTWDTIGWVLVIAGLGLLIAAFAIAGPMIMQALNNPEQFQRQGPMGGIAMSGAGIVVDLLGYVIRIAALVWMILELADRRGNWLWMIPFVPCCCCQFGWLIMGIYLLAGRQK